MEAADAEHGVVGQEDSVAAGQEDSGRRARNCVLYRPQVLRVKRVRIDNPKLEMDAIMKRVHRCKMGENVQTMANPAHNPFQYACGLAIKR